METVITVDDELEEDSVVRLLGERVEEFIDEMLNLQYRLSHQPSKLDPEDAVWQIGGAE